MRFIDVKTFTHGGTSHTTIKSVSYNKRVKRIEGGADGDKQNSYRFSGMETCTGTVVIEDPVQAAALVAASAGDLVYTGTPDTGATTLTVTIKGVKFFDDDSDAKHDDLHGCRVGFSAFNPGGPLVTVANA